MSAHQPVALAAGPCWRVLVVEDDGLQLEALSELLKKEFERQRVEHDGLRGRLQVDVAGTLQEAHRHLQRNHYHVVSVDDSVPGAAGELASRQGVANLIPWMAGRTLSERIVYSADLDSARVHVQPQWVREENLLSKLIEVNSSFELWTKAVVKLLTPTAALQAGAALLPRPLADVASVLHAERHHEQALWLDRALQFVDVSLRLAALQTLVLRAPGQAEPQRLQQLARDASLQACLDIVQQASWAVHAQDHSWFHRVRTCLSHWCGPVHDAVRALRRSLRPHWDTAHIHAVHDALHDCIALSAYWVLHPLWFDLRRGALGLQGRCLRGKSDDSSKNIVPVDMALEAGVFPVPTDTSPSNRVVQAALRMEGPHNLPVLVDWSDWVHREGDTWLLDSAREAAAPSGQRLLRWDLSTGRARGVDLGDDERSSGQH